MHVPERELKRQLRIFLDIALIMISMARLQWLSM